jgi:hypothetical protein
MMARSRPPSSDAALGTGASVEPSYLDAYMPVGLHHDLEGGSGMAHDVRGEFAQDQGELALHLSVDPTGDRILQEHAGRSNGLGTGSNRPRT